MKVETHKLSSPLVPEASMGSQLECSLNPRHSQNPVHRKLHEKDLERAAKMKEKLLSRISSHRSSSEDYTITIR